MDLIKSELYKKQAAEAQPITSLFLKKKNIDYNYWYNKPNSHQLNEAIIHFAHSAI